MPHENDQPLVTTGQPIGGVDRTTDPPTFHVLDVDSEGRLITASSSGGESNVNLTEINGAPVGINNPLYVETTGVGIQPTEDASDGTIGNAIPLVAGLSGAENPSGDLEPLQVNAQGALIVSATVGASVSATGAAIPADATMIGGSDGTDLRAIATDTSGQVKVLVENTVPVTGTFFQATQPVSGSVSVSNFPATQPVSGTVSVSGTVATTQSTSPWVVDGNLTHNNAAPIADNIGVLPAVASSTAPIYNAGDQVLLSTDLAGNLRTTATATVSGSVTANQGTPNTAANSWPVEMTDGTNILGTSSHPVRVDPTGTTTQPVSGTVSVSNFPATQPVSGTVVAEIEGHAGAILDGTAGSPSTGVLTVQGVSGGTSVPVSGTVTTTPPANASTNLTQVAGTTLGATAVTNFGTAPAAAVVPGVNASLFAGTQALGSTGNSLNVVPMTSSSAGLVGESNNAIPPTASELFVIPAVANAVAPSWTEGNQVLLSSALNGHLRVGTKTDNNAAPVNNTNAGVLVALANAATPTSVTEGNQVLLSTDLSRNLRITGRCRACSSARCRTGGGFHRR